jgi:copper homeostasis protein
VILEIIATSLDDALAAEQGGATRLEVVAHLNQDGLTPSLALVESIVTRVCIPARAMVRARNTFDVQDAGELIELQTAAREFGQLSVDGLVQGFINENHIDQDTCTALQACAPHLPITFHRAFDALPNPIIAMHALRDVGYFDCVLTSGGTGSWSERAHRLNQLHAHAAHVTVLVGSGVDEALITYLCEHTPIRAFHAGRAARDPALVDAPVSEQRVRAMRNALDAFCSGDFNRHHDGHKGYTPLA